jgi:UDP-perosamine 4-acetyltransferase
MGVPVVGGKDQIGSFNASETHVFIAIGENAERSRLFGQISDAGYTIPSLTHPSAIVSEAAKIEAGVAICAGCIINPMAQISTGAIVNTGSIVDHETKLGAFVHIAPGVNVAGRVQVGERTFIGIGASVADKLKIGEDVTVGAGSVVLNDVPAHSKVVGVSKILES